MDVGSGDRKMFYVELKPGETTIVSWKKLLRDSNNQNHKTITSQISHSAQGHPYESTSNCKPETNRLSAVVEKIDRLYVFKQSTDEEEFDDVPNDDQYDSEDSFIDDNELDEYFKVDNSTPRHNGYFVNKGQLEHMSEPKLSYDQRPKIMKGIDVSSCSTSTHDIHRGKNVFKQAEPLSDAPMSKTIEPEFSLHSFCRDNNILPDLNYPAPSPETSSKHVKDGSNVGKKGTMLERAIRDLEIIVAQSRPTKMVIQNGDTSFLSTKRRLPREVKQKLAKVARLAQSSQGQISEALINRLMDILGHMMQLRTLKRNLREMVVMGLSAKREKADSFEMIKREVIEMIKLRRSKQQDVTAGRMQECPHLEENYMDDTLEDKICDLFDLYVQGMDEDKGPHIRKLYIELAALWPNGSMDKHGIKKAISRAKDRKRVLYNHEKDQDKTKRKRMYPMKMEEMACNKASCNAQPQTVRKRQIINPSVDKLNKTISGVLSVDASSGPSNLQLPK